MLSREEKIGCYYLFKRREQKTDGEKRQIIDLMEKYGSVEYARRKALEFSKRAREVFGEKTDSLDDTFAKRAI